MELQQMKNLKVVIGANFGDEGKGLMTDYLASQYDKSIVVRFSGGAQAGHTVVTPDGIRHIFSHFGSGTLAGADTYLSKHFITNPILFKKEYMGLESKGLNPHVFVDEHCMVTTPYDMLINQIVEEFRGKNRHGSCGLGINETDHRHAFIPLFFADLDNKVNLVDKLFQITDDYVPKRLAELGVIAIPTKYADLLKNKNLIDNYIKDVDFMLSKAAFAKADVLHGYDNIIFEGSQGLLLDQNNKAYSPFLTPSNVGMQNVVEILNELSYNDNEVEIIYVTRCYMTRHGVGIFNTETPDKPYVGIVDMTNIANPFQGTLRFGLLDLDLLKNTIDKDLKFAKNSKLNYRMSLAITCLDQLDGTVDYFNNGIQHNSLAPFEFASIVDDKFTPNKMYLSAGLARDTIIYLDEVI
jgi:adenylosuccinate synthase